MNTHELGKKSVELHERRKQCYEEPKERMGYNPYIKTETIKPPKPEKKKIRIKIPKETYKLTAIIITAIICSTGIILNNINITITGTSLIIMIGITKLKEE